MTAWMPGKGIVRPTQQTREQLRKNREYRAAQYARRNGIRLLSDLTQEDWQKIELEAIQ